MGRTANLVGRTRVACWRSSTVEHLICNQQVVGSTPTIGSRGGGRAERYPSGQREQTVNLPASAYGGSNPPLSIYIAMNQHVARFDAGIAQLVRASAFQAEGRGFESRRPLVARVAQSVERVLGKDEVTGSIPVASLKVLTGRGHR